MAEITPPLFETVPGVYTGADLGLPYRDTIAQGVVGASDLSVVQRAAGANMSVDVGSGVAWVAGDESVLQPTYRVYNDATVNLVIAAADATNPRIDIVIAEVRDASFAGVSTDWRLRVVTGTAAASPAVPATPNNSLKLADVSVPALDTTIATAQITDKRSRAMVGGPLAPAYVTALPPEPYDGQEVYYAADPTNGVIWHLRYRAAATGSYKWDFVGGAPIRQNKNGSGGTIPTYATYGDASDGAGPSVTAPLGGDYTFDFGLSSTPPVTASYTSCGLAFNGSTNFGSYPAVDILTRAGDIGRVTGSYLVTGLAAGDVVKLVYSKNSDVITVSLRHIVATPVRVG